jgi:hypothetical protein
VREPALEHPERELLVVAAESRVQTVAVLDDRRLDLVEAVGPIALPDHRKQTLAPRLLCREEVAHATRGGDLVRHASILSQSDGLLFLGAC